MESSLYLHQSFFHSILDLRLTSLCVGGVVRLLLRKARKPVPLCEDGFFCPFASFLNQLVNASGSGFNRAVHL
jgi:hypothetical protein